MAKIKDKVRKQFKGKTIVEDETSGKLIRIVSETVQPDSEIIRHLKRKGKK